jgi:hypothetical protein
VDALRTRLSGPFKALHTQHHSRARHGMATGGLLEPAPAKHKHDLAGSGRSSAERRIVRTLVSHSPKSRYAGNWPSKPLETARSFSAPSPIAKRSMGVSTRPQTRMTPPDRLLHTMPPPALCLENLPRASSIARLLPPLWRVAGRPAVSRHRALSSGTFDAFRGA